MAKNQAEQGIALDLLDFITLKLQEKKPLYKYMQLLVLSLKDKTDFQNSFLSTSNGSTLKFFYSFALFEHCVAAHIYLPK